MKPPHYYLELFLQRIKKEANGCWIWTHTINSKGYAHFCMNGRLHTGGRAAWMLFRGVIPSIMVICHICDRRACVNPDHLFLGTQRDNVLDMFSKRGKYSIRGYPGTEHCSSKFTTKEIQNIRKRYRKGSVSFGSLAKELNVSRGCIQKIVTHKSYRNIP